MKDTKHVKIFWGNFNIFTFNLALQWGFLGLKKFLIWKCRKYTGSTKADNIDRSTITIQKTMQSLSWWAVTEISNHVSWNHRVQCVCKLKFLDIRSKNSLWTDRLNFKSVTLLLLVGFSLRKKEKEMKIPHGSKINPVSE